MSTPPPYPAPHPGVNWSQPRRGINWIGVRTLYEKEVRRFLNVAMQTVIAPMISGLLFLAIFVLALGRSGEMVGGVAFASFLAPGLIVMAMTQNAFANTSSSLTISKVQGNIVDLLMPPLGPGEILAALVLAGMTRGVVCGVTVAVGLVPFVEMGLPHPGYVLLHGLAGSAMLAILGVLAGLWAEKFDHLAAVTNFLIAPLAFLSGTFYSIERLPDAARAVAHANPFFYLIDGVRYGMTGHADGHLGAGIAIVFVVTALLYALTWRLFARGWKLKA